MIDRPKETELPLFMKDDPTTTDILFDAGNPGVYAAFASEARAIRAQGFKHYSARTIVHVLRHHSAVRDGSGMYKLNDHLSPILARRLVREDPSFANFFEFRKSRSDAA